MAHYNPLVSGEKNFPMIKKWLNSAVKKQKVFNFRWRRQLGADINIFWQTILEFPVPVKSAWAGTLSKRSSGWFELLNDCFFLKIKEKINSTIKKQQFPYMFL